MKRALAAFDCPRARQETEDTRASKSRVRRIAGVLLLRDKSCARPEIRPGARLVRRTVYTRLCLRCRINLERQADAALQVYEARVRAERVEARVNLEPDQGLLAR